MIERVNRSNGSPLEKKYRNESGYIHNLDGPAIIKYHSNGSYSYKAWVVKDKLHNLDGPAIVTLDKHGQILKEEWYSNGERHNYLGPAIKIYNKRWWNTSEEVRTSYYIAGQFIKEEKWKDYMFYKDFEETMLED